MQDEFRRSRYAVGDTLLDASGAASSFRFCLLLRARNRATMLARQWMLGLLAALLQQEDVQELCSHETLCTAATALRLGTQWC